MPHEFAPPVRGGPPAVGAMSSEDIDQQINVSKAEYERVRQEKIELERHEVKASDQLSAAQRTEIVAQKRNFVLMLDTIRKKIKDLEAVKANGGTANLTNGNGSSVSGNGGTGVSTFPTPVYNMGGIDGAIGAAVSGHAWPVQNPVSVGTFPAAAYGGMQPWNPLQPAQVAAVTAATQVEQATANQSQQQAEPTIESPGSEPSPSSRAPARRSHAVQIRAPVEGEQHDQSEFGRNGYPPYRPGAATIGVPSGEHPSNLNPASPSYEPGKPYPLTEGSPPHFVVPAPTPIETPNPPPAELAKHWVFSQQQVHAQSQQTHLSHTNTHTHTHSRSHAQEHARLAMNDMAINGRHDGNNMGAKTAHHDGVMGPDQIVVSIAVAVALRAFVVEEPEPRRAEHTKSSRVEPRPTRPDDRHCKVCQGRPTYVE